MNKQEVIHKLNRKDLSNHERECLYQLLHYMQTEGVDSAGEPNETRTPSRMHRSKKTHTTSRPRTRKL